MTKILVRRDDPEQRIELVKWQDVLRGWSGYTASMLTNQRTPAIFPRTTLREISESGDKK
jgi:hypothetical protein